MGDIRALYKFRSLSSKGGLASLRQNLPVPTTLSKGWGQHLLNLCPPSPAGVKMWLPPSLSRPSAACHPGARAPPGSRAPDSPEAQHGREARTRRSLLTALGWGARCQQAGRASSAKQGCRRPGAEPTGRCGAASAPAQASGSAPTRTAHSGKGCPTPGSGRR